MIELKPGTYQLVNKQTGQEYTIHIGAADVDLDDQFRGVSVTVPLPAKAGTTTYTIEVKVNKSKELA